MKHQFFCHLCGATFATYAAEAKHRHNAPLLCKSKGRKERLEKATKAHTDKDKK